MKGLFYRNIMRPLLLTTGTIVAASLIFASVVHMTGNTRYMARKLLLALGYPAPEYISPYEHGNPWTEDEWIAWFDRREGGEEE